VDLVHEEKSQILRARAFWNFTRIESSCRMSALGSIETLAEATRSGVFPDKARTYGLPQPKAISLGVQGCGKSLMAKAAAGYWRLPLLRLDVAALVSNSSTTAGGR